MSLYGRPQPFGWSPTPKKVHPEPKAWFWTPSQASSHPAFSKEAWGRRVLAMVARLVWLRGRLPDARSEQGKVGPAIVLAREALQTGALPFLRTEEGMNQGFREVERVEGVDPTACTIAVFTWM
jgi:hypothetical protein